MKFLFIITVLTISSVAALTCQNYHHDKCATTGCDVHCQALGKKSGYCSFSGSSCTCYCVAYKSDNTNLKVDKLNVTEQSIGKQNSNFMNQYYAEQDMKENSDNSSNNCHCMYAGQCYSCGYINNDNGQICTQKGTWIFCDSHIDYKICIRNVCSDIRH